MNIMHAWLVYYKKVCLLIINKFREIILEILPYLCFYPLIWPILYRSLKNPVLLVSLIKTVECWRVLVCWEHPAHYTDCFVVMFGIKDLLQNLKKGTEEGEAHCINNNANGTYDIFFWNFLWPIFLLPCYLKIMLSDFGFSYFYIN